MQKKKKKDALYGNQHLHGWCMEKKIKSCLQTFQASLKGWGLGNKEEHGRVLTKRLHK